MKNKLLIISTLILSSCAFHRGTIDMSPYLKGMSYKKDAIGVAEYTTILGIGGLSRDAIVNEAKKEMIKNYPLSDNETYINYTLNFKTSLYFIAAKTKVTLTAEVVEYSSKSLVQPRLASSSEVHNSHLFEIGDTVIFDLDRRGVIISGLQKNTVKVLTVNQNSNSVTKNIPIYKIFTDSKDYKGYRIGQEHSFIEIYGEKEVKIKSTIIGVGLSSLLLENDKGRRRELPIN